MGQSDSAPETSRKAQGGEANAANPPAGPRKSILLFSDGTGNSSAKLFKTNVWRLYEAVDLTPPEDGERPQIAYYDNGVGTSAFRPLRLLGGIFGVGLKRNVLRLYGFLCQNYEPGDSIYLFGFSRGAFTIRLLAGLIATQGIPRRGGTAAVPVYQVRAAWGEYCRSRLPNRFPAKLVAIVVRWVRDRFMGAWRWARGRPPYEKTLRHFPDIDFVGVWDTVAAYGGPFAELTRGIDDWVWPLTMSNYRLSPKVTKARHALSLDDERDAFLPLLWDEFLEKKLRTDGFEVVIGQKADGTLIKENRKPRTGRLKQVWFAGVHSDVGGGYPDESLSYIPLRWMVGELGTSIRFLKVFRDRAAALANPFGPIHDSRAGFSSYYRYQPRKIAAMLHPPEVSTRSLRDPEISREGGDHGLLLNVTVHDSVIARIVAGTDRYSPSALPADFEVDSTARERKPHAEAVALWERNNDRPDKAERRLRDQENSWNLVWRRRVVYFATIAATLLLLSLPLHGFFGFIDSYCGDDRCFAQQALDRIGILFPESLQGLLKSYTGKPIALILFGAIIFSLIVTGKRLERRFRDRVRDSWIIFLHGNWSDDIDPTPLRRFREHPIYQGSLFWLKWRIAPFVFGLVSLALIVAALAVTATQTFYALAEPRQAFCTNRDDMPDATAPKMVEFKADSSCTDLQSDVVAGTEYIIDLHLKEPLRDGDPDSSLPSFGADPVNGVNEPLRGPIKWAGAFKRVTGANWLQPLTEVRNHQPDHPVKRGLAWLIGPDIEIRKTNFVEVARNHYVATICPRQKGHLYLMLNDAAPLGLKTFYDNNQGGGFVSVTRLGACKPPR